MPVTSAISSLPFTVNSGWLRSPLLTRSAAFASLRSGTITMKYSPSVDHRQGRDKSQGEIQQQGLEGLVGDSQRHLGGHRDDLRAHHFIRLPAKAVRAAVSADLGRGSAAAGVLWHCRQPSAAAIGCDR
jgi:hypothetical protein